MTVAILRPWSSGFNGRDGERLCMWCPGCEEQHCIEVKDKSQASWDFDGNLEAPTITPSIKRTAVQWEPSYKFHRPNHKVEPGNETICHSFVRNGNWEFLPDCTHHLAGQTVPLPPLPAHIIPDDQEGKT